jgi:hypothetical protein
VKLKRTKENRSENDFTAVFEAQILALLDGYLLLESAAAGAGAATAARTGWNGLAFFALFGSEGRTATAGRSRVGIVDFEAAAHHVIDEVDVGAFQILGATRVDDNAHAIDGKLLVAFHGLFFESHAIGIAATAAARDENAQHCTGLFLLLQEAVNLFSGAICDVDHYENLLGRSRLKSDGPTRILNALLS